MSHQFSQRATRPAAIAITVLIVALGLAAAVFAAHGLGHLLHDVLGGPAMRG
jgi:hypothetical protein